MINDEQKTKEQLLAEIIQGQRKLDAPSDTNSETALALWEGAALRKLYEITSQPALDSEAKTQRLLEMGCQQLGLENFYFLNQSLGF